MIKLLKRALKPIYNCAPLLPVRALLRSAGYFNAYYRRSVLDILATTFRRPHEVSNFTYDLTPRNVTELAHVIALVTGRDVREIRDYINEARNDQDLHDVLYERLKTRGHFSDAIVNPFARRVGWYAIARAIRPRVIVETGVDRGHGSLILCAALLRNAQDDHPGRYYGTDINPEAGWLLTGKYAQVGTILYGDSIESLSKLNETIDLFINDSDHCEAYEYREYQVIEPKLSLGAVILSDNAHTNDRLASYSEETGRSYVFFKETPRDHWYPGAGIGISVARRA
jgi:predicted O-methyltransferase YrrM